MERKLITTIGLSPNDQAFTERQRNLKNVEDKKKIMAAMEPGVRPVPGELESPIEHTTSSTSAREPQHNQAAADFEPYTFFVYGTLMDPEMLMAVAGMGHQPELKDAWVQGFELKMRKGIYPVLLTGNLQNHVRGKVWQATTSYGPASVIAAV